MEARGANPAEVTSKVYIRDQNSRNEAQGIYRIPPGYHGNAFPETENTRAHTPQIYFRGRNPERLEYDIGMKIYSPRQRDTVMEPPYRDSTEKSIAVREENTETDVQYGVDFTANTADSTWEDTTSDFSVEEPVEAMEPNTDSGGHTEEKRLLGEVFSALFRNLRREDWLLVALITLFLLDGSASPDVLVLLAVLLAYHT